MGIGQAALQEPTPGQTFFLNRESLGFFRSLFSLKGRVIQKVS